MNDKYEGLFAICMANPDYARAYIAVTLAELRDRQQEGLDRVKSISDTLMGIEAMSMLIKEAIDDLGGGDNG